MLIISNTFWFMPTYVIAMWLQRKSWIRRYLICFYFAKLFCHEVRKVLWVRTHDALLYLPNQVYQFGPLHKHAAFHFEVFFLLIYEFLIFYSNMYIFEGFFHIIGLYIHGTKGFAKQIYVNHRIGNFLETNKINVFETIIDCSLKKLLSKMGNILPSHNRQTGFKNIKSSKKPVLHQELLLHNEKVLGKIQITVLFCILSPVQLPNNSGAVPPPKKILSSY